MLSALKQDEEQHAEQGPEHVALPKELMPPMTAAPMTSSGGFCPSVGGAPSSRAEYGTDGDRRTKPLGADDDHPLVGTPETMRSDLLPAAKNRPEPCAAAHMRNRQNKHEERPRTGPIRRADPRGLPADT
jgi:hypothetical protein